MRTSARPTTSSVDGRARVRSACRGHGSWCGRKGDFMSHDDGLYSNDAASSNSPLYPGEIASVLVTEEQIRCRTIELAHQVAADFQAEHGNGDLLLVGVLKGAVMFMTDFARALPIPVQLEFMAVSSYGSASSS